MNTDFYLPIRDDNGNVTGTRLATDDELKQIAPREATLRGLKDAVDQLILDTLMGPA